MQSAQTTGQQHTNVLSSVSDTPLRVTTDRVIRIRQRRVIIQCHGTDTREVAMSTRLRYNVLFLVNSVRSKYIYILCIVQSITEYVSPALPSIRHELSFVEDYGNLNLDLQQKSSLTLDY